MKTVVRIAMFLFVAAALITTTSCAWFQKNEAKFVCAAESTITDAPELVAIVTECAAISVDTANIVPCILAAAGSKWTEDVVACIANTVASTPTSTIATNAQGITSVNLSRLRAAVTAKWGKQLGLQ